MDELANRAPRLRHGLHQLDIDTEHVGEFERGQINVFSAEIAPNEAALAVQVIPQGLRQHPITIKHDIRTRYPNLEAEFLGFFQRQPHGNPAISQSARTGERIPG